MSEIKKTQLIADNWKAAVETGAANQPNRVTAEESALILKAVTGGMGVSKGELAAAESLWGDVKAKYDGALQARSAAEESLTGLQDAERNLNAFLDTVDGIAYLLGKSGSDDPVSEVFAGDQKETIAAMKAEIAGARAALSAAVETLSAVEANLAQATGFRDAVLAERASHWGTTKDFIDSYFETHPDFAPESG